MKSRLFRKIFAAYAVTLLVVIALDGLFVAYQTHQDIPLQVREDLSTGGLTLRLIPLEKLVANTPFLSQSLKARLTIIDAQGKVLADSEQDSRKMDNHFSRPEIQEARSNGEGHAIRHSDTLDIEMMYVAFPLKIEERIVGYARVAKPLEELKTAIDQSYRIIFRVALTIIISFLLLALLFIPKLISPLLTMTDYTERARTQKAPGSLMVQSGDEIGQLAENINLLVQNYEDNIRIVREEKGKLTSVFTSMVEGIVILNRQNRIELINPGASDILGNRYSEMTGKTIIEAFRNVELQNALDRCRKTGQPVFQEIALDGGNQLFLNVNIAPIKDLPGQDNKIIVVFHDVTQLRKLERVRADFVANVSHELKTPLTAIIGFVQTLQEGAINDKETAGRFLTIIAEHAGRLNRLVDDLLILSRIELGEVALHPEKMDPRQAVQQALTIIEDKARKKGLAVRQDWPENLPLILADGDGIVQILVNVLDNAVKFTAAGDITISADRDEKGFLAITIADTGTGIPANEIPRLGERFYRVDKMRSRELGGTGLGLSIVKHLLQAQQGRWEVESSPGKGTVVKLFFPLFATPVV